MISPFSPRTLTTTRIIGSSLLLDRCQLDRPGALISDGMGGTTRGSTTVTTVSCLYEEIHGRGFELVLGGAVRPIIDRRMYLLWDADIEPTDQVRYPVGGSTIYELMDVPPPTALDTVRVVRLKT